jgi:hypothetical protein
MSLVALKAAVDAAERGPLPPRAVSMVRIEFVQAGAVVFGAWICESCRHFVRPESSWCGFCNKAVARQAVRARRRRSMTLSEEEVGLHAMPIQEALEAIERARENALERPSPYKVSPGNPFKADVTCPDPTCGYVGTLNQVNSHSRVHKLKGKPAPKRPGQQVLSW